jgi:hypothetical protein
MKLTSWRIVPGWTTTSRWTPAGTSSTSTRAHWLTRATTCTPRTTRCIRTASWRSPSPSAVRAPIMAWPAGESSARGMSSCSGPASGTGTNSASGWSCTTAGAFYLRSIPASTGDIKLITVIGAVGVLLGLLAGALMKVRLTEDGSLVTVTGASYAAVWIAAIGGRLLFAYGQPLVRSRDCELLAQRWYRRRGRLHRRLCDHGPGHGCHPRRRHRIPGCAGDRGLPWNEHRAVVGLRHDHAHLHHHAH